MEKIAIIYDFDGTLARGNIQEASFLPALNVDKNEFWIKVKELTRNADADEILVYMNEMLERARDAGQPIDRQFIKNHGEKADLFQGLKDGCWFDRMNLFALERKISLHHFVISSGIREMILGCPIASRFDKVYASTFLYSEDGEAKWPAVAINYTTKTQFLFRINKGISNTWDNQAINTFMPENERPIPFRRMIFIGDGDTDIPCLKLVSNKGGHAIAVYDPECSIEHLDKIHKLISDDRANFIAPADYRPNSTLDIAVRGIIGRIARECGYRPPTGATT